MENWSNGVMGFRNYSSERTNSPTLHHSITPICLALALCFLLHHASLWAQTPFYSGKTLKIVVGSASGGGYDLWARLLAQYIGKHIPGHPNVIVQNMPGAGGVTAANFIYNIAKPDGLTLGAYNPAMYFEQLVGRPETKFDFAKYSWIGSPEKNDALCRAHSC